MSRVESMPTWMLRYILSVPFMRRFWSAAWLELRDREVREAVEIEVDPVHGPWLVVAPAGVH